MTFTFDAFGRTVYIEIAKKHVTDAFRKKEARHQDPEARTKEGPRPVSAFFRRVRQHFTKH